MQIIFLTNLFPLPLDNGGKIKTFSTLSALKTLGHDIDLVCFTETTINPELKNVMNSICRNVTTVNGKITTRLNKGYMAFAFFISFVIRYPFSIYKFRSHLIDKEIAKLMRNHSYDIAWFDHLQTRSYGRNIFKRFKAIQILDEHNCEYLIYKRFADREKNLVKKILYINEFYKLKKYELQQVRYCNYTLALSLQDKMSLENKTNKRMSNKMEIIPICVQDRGVRIIKNNSITLNILFVGTLTWKPNSDGIEWFIDQVIPLLKQEHIEHRLYIIGKGSSNKLECICAKNDSVSLIGYSDSLEEYYNICDVLVVPLFCGSGQRVKILEAFSMGMPVISTTIGAEGIICEHGVNVLIADNSQQFIESLKCLKDKCLIKKLGNKSRLLWELEYSEPMFIKKISMFLDKLDISKKTL